MYLIAFKSRIVLLYEIALSNLSSETDSPVETTLEVSLVLLLLTLLLLLLLLSLLVLLMLWLLLPMLSKRDVEVVVDIEELVELLSSILLNSRLT